MGSGAGRSRLGRSRPGSNQYVVAEMGFPKMAERTGVVMRELGGIKDEMGKLTAYSTMDIRVDNIERKLILSEKTADALDGDWRRTLRDAERSKSGSFGAGVAPAAALHPSAPSLRKRAVNVNGGGGGGGGEGAVWDRFKKASAEDGAAAGAAAGWGGEDGAGASRNVSGKSAKSGRRIAFFGDGGGGDPSDGDAGGGAAKGDSNSRPVAAGAAAAPRRALPVPAAASPEVSDVETLDMAGPPSAFPLSQPSAPSAPAAAPSTSASPEAGGDRFAAMLASLRARKEARSGASGSIEVKDAKSASGSVKDGKSASGSAKGFDANEDEGGEGGQGGATATAATTKSKEEEKPAGRAAGAAAPRPASTASFKLSLGQLVESGESFTKKKQQPRPTPQQLWRTLRDAVARSEPRIGLRGARPRRPGGFAAIASSWVRSSANGTFKGSAKGKGFAKRSTGRRADDFGKGGGSEARGRTKEAVRGMLRQSIRQTIRKERDAEMEAEAAAEAALAEARAREEAAAAEAAAKAAEDAPKEGPAKAEAAAAAPSRTLAPRGASPRPPALVSRRLT
eukprot:tig00001041_g6572.t1